MLKEKFIFGYFLFHCGYTIFLIVSQSMITPVMHRMNIY